MLAGQSHKFEQVQDRFEQAQAIIMKKGTMVESREGAK